MQLILVQGVLEILSSLLTLIATKSLLLCKTSYKSTMPPWNTIIIIIYVTHTQLVTFPKSTLNYSLSLHLWPFLSSSYNFNLIPSFLLTSPLNLWSNHTNATHFLELLLIWTLTLNYSTVSRLFYWKIPLQIQILNILALALISL